MNEIKKTPIYRFTGAGNNFVVLDGRGKDMASWRGVSRVQELCRQFRTDGMMILETAEAWTLPWIFTIPTEAAA